LNFAAIWELPVVFVCENNLYATEMPFAQATKNTNVASRAAAYNMPGYQVDGNNVLEVYAKAGEAVATARRGGGPTLLECLTYRWFGHHEGDAGTSYRAKEEITTWKEIDPIRRLRDQALTNSWATGEQFAQIDREVEGVIRDAAEYAVRCQQPDVSTALDHVFNN
jgi:2-oxoisovalerate dehydrogenase E1 component